MHLRRRQVLTLLILVRRQLSAALKIGLVAAVVGGGGVALLTVAIITWLCKPLRQLSLHTTDASYPGQATAAPRR